MNKYEGLKHFSNAVVALRNSGITTKDWNKGSTSLKKRIDKATEMDMDYWNNTRFM